MKPIAPQRDDTGATDHSMTTQVRLQGSDADGLIRISAGDNGP